MHSSTLIFFVSLGVAFAAVIENPLSDEFIDKINKLGTTWKAGRNFDINTSPSYIKGLLGVLPGYKSSLPETVTKLLDNLPETFDARQQWSNCKSLNVVRDQSVCGSCWAFAAVEAMSDRICISSNGAQQVSISANDLVSCCGNYCGNGCNGGYPADAWNYWVLHGIVSGGLYGSTDGCQSYVFPPCEHHTTGSLEPCGDIQSTPKCTRKCDNSTLNYNQELYYGKKAYNVGRKQEQIKSEIYANGPVEASFNVYEDFLTYKSGVYQKVSGSYQGGHSVKIIGWGEENNTPYWLVANSWNEDWGDKGFFKILRGKNECEIEKNIVAGLPKL